MGSLNISIDVSAYNTLIVPGIDIKIQEINNIKIDITIFCYDKKLEK